MQVAFRREKSTRAWNIEAFLQTGLSYFRIFKFRALNSPLIPLNCRHGPSDTLKSDSSKPDRNMIVLQIHYSKVSSKNRHRNVLLAKKTYQNMPEKISKIVRPQNFWLSLVQMPNFSCAELKWVSSNNGFCHRHMTSFGVWASA